MMMIGTQPCGPDARAVTELRAVRRLTTADILRISDDARSFQMVCMEKLTGTFAGRLKVTLRSLDCSGNVTLIRSPGDCVRVLL